jgi:hypothetical protein
VERPGVPVLHAVRIRAGAVAVSEGRQPFAAVKRSALTQEARDVLDRASTDWRRMQQKHSATIAELESFGLVQTETRWQWSTRDSGAGRHVTWWRLHEGQAIHTCESYKP